MSFQFVSIINPFTQLFNYIFRSCVWRVDVFGEMFPGVCRIRRCSRNRMRGALCLMNRMTGGGFVMEELCVVRGSMESIMSKVRSDLEDLGCIVIGDTLVDGTYRLEDVGHLELIRSSDYGLNEYDVSCGLRVVLNVFVEYGHRFGSVGLEIKVNRVVCEGNLEESLVRGRGYVEVDDLGVRELRGNLVKLGGNLGKDFSLKFSDKIKI